VKSKRTKTKETDKKNVNSGNAKSEGGLFSHLTFHVSRFTAFNRFTVFTDSRFHIACLVFLIVVIYANTLNVPFQWDESDFIVNNPIIKDLHYFSTPSDANGLKLYSSLINRYIGFLTFALNYRIHGLSVTGYHIVNIAIHIANSILVYFLVLLTFRTPFLKTVNGEEVNDEWSPPPIPPPPGGRVREGERHSLFTIHHSRPLNDSRPLIAFFSAAIFAVHPLQTEAVTYIFQRLASLAAFFYLLSLVFYIKARIGNGLNGKKVIPYSQITFLLISLVSAVLAMKTKENAFTLPIMITLYEFCFFNKTYRPSPIAHRPASFDSRAPHASFPHKGGGLGRGGLIPIVLTLLIIPLTLMSLTGSHHLNPSSYGSQVFSRNEYLFTEFRVIVTYLRLLFFPVNQHIDYDYPLFKSFFVPQVILSFLFLSLLFGLGVYLVIKAKDTKENDSGQAGMTKKVRGSRHSGLSGIVSRFTSHVSRPLRLIGFGILWFFITLSVESSIIPLPMLLDEYRVYLPSVGLIISAVTGVFWLFSRFTLPPPIPPPQGGRVSEGGHYPLFTIHYSRFLLMFLVVAVGVLTVAAHLRNEVWRDNISLWKDAVEKSPGNARAHNNLGFLYTQKKLYAKAMNELNIAISLSPGYADPYHNLGVIYQELNMFDKAIEQYLIAIRLGSTFEETHFNLGTIYQARNMFDKAIEQYLLAIKIRPDYIEAHYNLGVIYQELNMFDKAIEQYLIVVDLNPDLPQARFNLGAIYQARNMFDKAIEQYRSAIELKPDYVKAHNNLGVVYEARSMFDKAIEQYRSAANLKPNDAEAHFNLGSVYYKMGQMEKAREELTSGLKIKPDDRQAQQLLKAVKRES
jgi:tetratricopeptide (TPR) repeat protein